MGKYFLIITSTLMPGSIPETQKSFVRKKN